MCAAGRRGSHSRGPPGGLARVLSGRGVTSPSAWSSPPAGSRRAGLGCPPACPAEPAVALRPQGDASSAQVSWPRHAAASGRGRGGEQHLLGHLRLSGKSGIAPPASQGPKDEDGSQGQGGSLSFLTVKWGQNPFYLALSGDDTWFPLPSWNLLCFPCR